MIDYRHAVLAAALLASAGVANAQTTVITREPAETRTVVTTGQIALTPVQRQTVVRTIARERVNPAAPTVVYEVGTRVPDTVELYPVPESLAVEVPAVRPYRYMVVNGRVVLVDPATSQVVADISE